MTTTWRGRGFLFSVSTWSATTGRQVSRALKSPQRTSFTSLMSQNITFFWIWSSDELEMVMLHSAVSVWGGRQDQHAALRRLTSVCWTFIYKVQKKNSKPGTQKLTDHIMNMNTDECDDTDELIAAEVKGDRQTSPETAKIQFYFLNVLRKKNLFSDLPSLQ